MGLQFLGDFFLTAGRTDDDAVRMQLLLVIGEAADADGVRTEEAVAASDVSGRDAGDREFQGLAVEHRDDPSNGANEAGGVEASPSHRAWPGDVVDGAGEDGREDLFRGPAELGLLGGEVLALRGLDQKELVDVDTLLLGETQCGACRRADGIIGHGLRGAGDFRLTSGCFTGSPWTQAVRRRGAPKVSTVTPSERFSAERSFSMLARRSSSAFGSIPAGISSHPISNRSSTRFSIASLAAGFMPAPRAERLSRRSVPDTLRRCGTQVCARAP